MSLVLWTCFGDGVQIFIDELSIYEAAYDPWKLPVLPFIYLFMVN